ncbi:MAG: YgiQ family radical SAM protein [Phycisphaerales bacterium]|nr:YgiQ family radical SAM protein [Phycisphaerales bacterium]
MITNARASGTACSAPALIPLTLTRGSTAPSSSACEHRCDPRPLPMTRREMDERGWDAVDIVFVTGDAYVDHPSFAMALLGRVLEAEGFRVAILAQPDWHSCEPWRTFGRPRGFFAVSAGNMDSMINHYTANRKVRNDDAYSPGGRIGLRPDRATLAYCHRAREAYKDVPIIAGGVEASLRRLAHYDYWSDTVRRSILLDSKADLLVYGMGESAIVEMARRMAEGTGRRAKGEAQMAKGEGRMANEEGSPDQPAIRHSAFSIRQSLRDMRGVAYALGAKESPPAGADVVTLPSYEEVKSDKLKFAQATRRYHLETNPYNAKTLVQRCGDQHVVVTPPRLPESESSMDRYYDLPYTRKPHPSYTEPIPAHQVIKDSITLMRGCFGGCTFCSITMHQGRIIQSRSKDSILREVNTLASDPGFKGAVSDLGGPTANMYKMQCLKPEIEAICRRLSCVHPKICPLLGTDHAPLIDVMREARAQRGVKKVLVASGVRMDLARRSPEYMRELTLHHVGGHLKVAPEHTDDKTLALMKKTRPEDFEDFSGQFRDISKRAGRKQYLVPYFISSHPGSTVESMIELAVFLKRNGYRPDQVQDFIPAPMDLATCMYYTGVDPMTGKPVHVATKLRERKFQRALLQFFKPANYFTVRRLLLDHGRADLIGDGCDALIPSKPPKEAIEARRQQAERVARREPAGVRNGTRGRSQEGAPGRSQEHAPGRSQEGATPASPSSPWDLSRSMTVDEEDHYHSPPRTPPAPPAPPAPRGYRPGRRTAGKRHRA